MGLESLQTTEQPEDTAVLRSGAKGNVSVGGLKNVSLEGAQSSDIRERLMQMIAERERGNPMQEALGHLALAGSAPGEFNRNYNEYQTRKRQQEQDLLGMRVSAAQLASEEARLKRDAEERAMWAQRLGLGGNQPAVVPQAPKATGGGLSAAGGADTMMGAEPATGGLGLNAQRPQGPGTDGQPAGGLSAVRPQTAFTPPPTPQQQQDSMLQSLPVDVRVGLMGLQKSNPTKFAEQLVNLSKPTDMQRELSFLSPDAYKSAALAKHTGNSAEYITVPDPQNPGFDMRIPRMQLQNQMYGIPPQQPGAPAAISAPMGSNAPAAPAPMGSGAPAQAAPTAAPAQATGAVTTPNPFPRNDPRWAAFENERAKANINVQESAAKDVGKGDAAEITKMSLTVSKAPEIVGQLDKALEALDKYPTMFGRLMKPTLTSMVLNMASQGVSGGRLGNIGFPGVNEYAIQMDPVARKDPKAINAWFDVAGAMNKVISDYTAIANEGQGTVSNSEREMYKTAVGDPAKIDAQGLKQRILVARLNYQHTQEAYDMWNANKGKYQNDFQRFKSSPEFQSLQEKQYYNAANALGVKNPQYKRSVDTGAGGEDEAARLRRELRGQ